MSGTYFVIPESLVALRRMLNRRAGGSRPSEGFDGRLPPALHFAATPRCGFGREESEMQYIRVRWKHALPDEPVELLSELDSESWEVRKVEVFRDGRLGF